MSEDKAPQPGSRRMPKDSIVYEKIVPIAMVVLGLGLVAVVVVALAAVLGWIHL
ncbi:MAG: hypothetical protein HY259_08360 [Chloroflexi bacterium]|nr:hypothetical protein [Chloroflexota bacterium]MBI3733452.1 hypothetical protein [Chloroflexota bacterium]